MLTKLKALFYLPWWFFQTRFLGKRKPLQTVLFVGDRCNLQCKHCSVYQKTDPHKYTYEQVREHLEYSYGLGARFVDFEGGETMLWRDGERDINDLIRLAKEIGFFSATITTNAQLPFGHCIADSIWVSLDGIGKYHEAVRGEGTFARLEKNIAASNHKAVSVNMAINNLNRESVDETIEYVKGNPHIKSISLNFHTPFPGTEYLMIDREKRNAIIDKIIEYKRRGYPIMNSVSGLKRMKDMDFEKSCWVTNFIYPDGQRGLCIGYGTDACKDCGFCMAGEMYSVFHFRPDTIMAGLSLRV